MRSRPFIVLAFAVFVATFGLSMVSPVLSSYAEKLGASGVTAGLAFSSFALTMMVVAPFSGRLSDRFGRKPFIVIGLLAYLVAAIGYLAATNVWHLIAFRAISGIGTSLVFALARAYIGDLVPRGHEGRWLGVFMTADIVGFSLGPLVTGVLRETAGFDSVFIAQGLLLAAAAAIVLVLLPPAPEPRTGDSDHAAEPAMTILQALQQRIVAATAILMAFGVLVFGVMFGFLSVRLDELDVAPTLVGVVFAANGLATAVAQPFAGRAADRMDRRFVAIAGLVLTATLMAALVVSERYLVILALVAGMGVGTALTTVAGVAIQVVAGRRAGMGTVLGLSAAGEGLGILAGALLGGLFADQFSSAAAFGAGAGALLVGAVIFGVLMIGVPVREVAPEASPLSPEARA